MGDRLAHPPIVLNISQLGVPRILKLVETLILS
jgi:hypothetical protein